MEVMKGGNGDSSYANNSLLQKTVLLMTNPIAEKAIQEVYATILPRSFGIADLGCSSGPNTFLAVTHLMNAVERKCLQLGHETPEFLVLLNDLPSNDFNNIFISLPDFYKKQREEKGERFGPCFIAGVPGSFYERLFLANSLHFVHSSYSLHWLSKVPQGIENNKGNIYMAKTSPPNVFKAYLEQFQTDFSLFLRSRSEEVIPEGKMVLTFLGRTSEDPSSKECCYIWDLLATALNDMVSERLIEEEKLDSFNLPHYTPSPTEVKSVVQKEGSFGLDGIEIFELNWDYGDRVSDCGYKVAKYVRAVIEALLLTQFEEGIIEELFMRYAEILGDRMSKEKTEFVNLVVCMTRKG